MAIGERDPICTSVGCPSQGRPMSAHARADDLAYAVDALLDAYDEERPDAVAEIIEALREIRSR